MTNITPKLKFFMNLAKTQAILTRKFDSALGGMCLTEFMILLHLSQAKDEKLRRIDLADKIGLTASGVTRILLPMEKIGLIKKEVNEMDARVSFVLLAPAGRKKLDDTLEDAEYLVDEIIPADKNKKLEEMSNLISNIH